jgi:hypothetical protein
MKLEDNIMLRLFKEFNIDFNASRLGESLNATRIGTYKALKQLEKKGLVKGRFFGKSRFYTLDLNDDYVKKTLSLLLLEESRLVKKWADEFKEIYPYSLAAIIFGSILKDEKKAGDIDLLLILDPENNDKINKIIQKKDNILTKKIHPIKQTREELIKNLKNKDPVLLSALKEGIILYGHDSMVETLKNVTNR